MIYGDGFVESNFTLGGSVLGATLQPEAAFSGRFLWQLERAALLRLLAEGRSRLKFNGALRDGVLAGWQRGSAAGQRVMSATFAQGVPYLPSFEIQLVDPKRYSTVWIGY